ncbi:MAG TPA: FG-GAP-like repeat-containing protein, partial [Thermoanaerobaculia bacterium]|nr:FG-GAP-like repeat-containing protein [Thermoanaerobaculia bacterium]
QPAPAAATSTSAAGQIPEGGVPAWIHPETPQHRRDRLGVEDPGPNPDPNKHFWRYGNSFHIERYERRLAAYDREDGSVRPLAQVNFAFEIYQQNEKYVWVWVPDPEPTTTPAGEPIPPPSPKSRYNDAVIAFFKKIRPQFTALEPPMSSKTIRFEESSEGLPKEGSWRNSLAVADMNEDGCPDIIAPPQRGTSNFPAIFLGDCKGHWKIWDKTSFPHSFDYGAVVVADFNKDGHMDVAFAVHLTGVYVYLGDGKGNFKEVSEGLPRDFATRHLAITDANNDGYPDIVAITEGPSVQGMGNPRYGNVRLYLNKKKGTEWAGMDIVQPGVKTGADWMSVGNFNGDKYPDFAFGSIFQGSVDILYMSKGPGAWKALETDGDLIPSQAYYMASTAGKFSSKTLDDAILSDIRYWPGDLDESILKKPPIMEMTSIDRFSFTKDGAKRTSIARWSGHEGVSGLASGDFDGDGNLDIVYTRSSPREGVVLLGDGKGGFTRAKTEGLTIAPQRNYDITVADVNGDGKPDIIVMYETSGTSSLGINDGSIHVFLNRGVVKPETAGARKK